MSARTRHRREDRRHHPAWRPLLIAAGVALALLLCAGAVFAAWVAGVVETGPNIGDLQPQPAPAVSTVLASDGSRIGFITGDQLRLPATLNDVPKSMRAATIAIEDRRFYHHGGVDPVAIARAAAADLVSGKTVQGASSLAMQLVRNLYLPQTRGVDSLKRKVREAKLAMQLASKHSKRWILTQYLDNVPYGTVGGQTAVGVAAASRVFFDEPSSALTLPQAALLAGLPQAPTSDNPFLHPGRAEQRRAEVLQAMAGAGAITRAQAAAANRASLGLHPNDYFQQVREPYVVDYVKRELRHRYSAAAIRRGGLRIQTSIDPRLQTLGRQAIADHLDQPGQPAAAITTIDPRNGAIRALVTSTDYRQSEFDYATDAHRQAGSTFKAIDLMAAVREGVDPNNVFYDSHLLSPGWLPQAPTWSVQTDDNTYHGTISLSEAIALSDNTVYAQLGADLGGDTIRQAAYDMGITSHLDGYPAESIGGLRTGVTPLEMADAYATIADGGVRNRATAIASVEQNGATLAPRIPAAHKREFTDGQAAEVTGALKGVLTHGTAAGDGIGCPAAGKTGTTSSFTDAWFVGFTPRLSTSVWVGYPDDTTSMDAVPGYGQVFGATIPAPIWQEYMKAVTGGSCAQFPAPTTPFVSQPWDGPRQVSGDSASKGASGGTQTTTTQTGTTPTGTTQTDTTPTGTTPTDTTQTTTTPSH